MSLRLAHLVTFLALLVLPTSARGDGKFFGTAVAYPTIPDQQAMIVWDGSTETLIIETSVVSPEGELSWVVPVPAPPEITAVDTGLFPTLAALTATRVRSFGHLGLLFLSTVAIAVTFAVIVEWLATSADRTLATLGKAVATMLVVVLIGALFLPALGTARGVAGLTSRGSIDVLDERRIGSFDTAVVTATDAEVLAEWLTGRGFQVSAAARDAMDAYVADGWCFVVSRLAADAEGAMRPHPLALRFPADRPVYPMRLTGVENTDLHLRLYVFAEIAAHAGGLRQTVALPLVRRAADGVAGPLELPRTHERLRDLPSAVSWCSVLEGTLAPSMQAEDLDISFAAARAHRPMITSEDDARRIGLVTGSFAMMLVVIGLRLLPTSSTRTRLFALAALAIGAGAGVAVGRTTTCWIDGQPVWRVSHAQAISQARRIGVAFRDGLTEEERASLTLDSARALLQDLIATGEPMNRWTREPLRLERSPGNVILREVDDGAIELVTLDGVGGEAHVFRLRESRNGTAK